MKQLLFNLYNKCRDNFIEGMTDILKAKGNEMEFSPYIRIPMSNDSDDFFEDITEIKFDKEENTWYVHNYITDMNLQVDEYWTPLRNLSFDELYKIAERL